ncbi:MAG: hypothetical protein OXC65_15940 [Thiotrichales bacterium]|nr:hypothetical protein [Thiotrichales bacterium]
MHPIRALLMCCCLCGGAQADAGAWQSELKSHTLSCLSEGPEVWGERITHAFLGLVGGRPYADAIPTGGQTYGLDYAYVVIRRGQIYIGFDNGTPGERVAVADKDGDGRVDAQRTPFRERLAPLEAQLLYCRWGLFFLGRHGLYAGPHANPH